MNEEIRPRDKLLNAVKMHWKMTCRRGARNNNSNVGKYNNRKKNIGGEESNMPMSRAIIFCIRGLRHWEEAGTIDINRKRDGIRIQNENVDKS